MLCAMKDNFIGSVGIWGCGSPAETSAEGRSTDRAGRRDRRMNNIRSRAEEIVLKELIFV